jgi:hypothetical protein
VSASEWRWVFPCTIFLACSSIVCTQYPASIGTGGNRQIWALGDYVSYYYYRHLFCLCFFFRHIIKLMDWSGFFFGWMDECVEACGMGFLFGLVCLFACAESYPSGYFLETEMSYYFDYQLALFHFIILCPITLEQRFEPIVEYCVIGSSDPNHLYALKSLFPFPLFFFFFLLLFMICGNTT